MPFLKLDDALIAMIDGHRETIEAFLGLAHCGPAIHEAEIMWDLPMQKGDAWDEEDAKVSHAVGFICGCAAAFDVTPLELLDTVRSVPTLQESLRQMAGVSDPSKREHAVIAARLLTEPLPMRMLSQREIMEAQGFEGDPPPRAKRTTSQRRAKLPKVRLRQCSKCGRILDSEGECRGGCSQ